MRAYLISYAFITRNGGSGTGRLCYTLPDNKPLSFKHIEEIENKIKAQHGFQGFNTVAVSELPGGMG